MGISVGGEDRSGPSSAGTARLAGIGGRRGIIMGGACSIVGATLGSAIGASREYLSKEVFFSSGQTELDLFPFVTATPEAGSLESGDSDSGRASGIRERIARPFRSAPKHNIE